MGLFENYAYRRYQRAWCKARGFAFRKVRRAEKRGLEYKGQMYACKDEFLTTEYLDAAIMKGLLNADDFYTWQVCMLARNNT